MKKDNTLLAKITLITSLGDFLSFFAVLKVISELGYSSIYSGYSVVIKSLAIIVGGFFLPLTLKYIKTKHILYYSQLVSGIALLILIFGFHFKSISLTTIFVLFFIQSLFKQLFEGARETHSKFQGENANQLSLQSQILSGLYNAQFVGPILSYLLIKSLPIEIPLTLDCLSFFLAAFIASKLTHSPPIQKGEATHVFAPFFYLNKFPKLRDITLLRSIGFWLGNGLFNYLMFAVVTEHFKLDIINSTWTTHFSD